LRGGGKKKSQRKNSPGKGAEKGRGNLLIHPLKRGEVNSSKEKKEIRILLRKYSWYLGSESLSPP